MVRIFLTIDVPALFWHWVLWTKLIGIHCLTSVHILSNSFDPGVSLSFAITNNKFLSKSLWSWGLPSPQDSCINWWVVSCIEAGASVSLVSSMGTSISTFLSFLLKVLICLAISSQQWVISCLGTELQILNNTKMHQNLLFCGSFEALRFNSFEDFYFGWITNPDSSFREIKSFSVKSYNLWNVWK